MNHARRASTAGNPWQKTRLPCPPGCKSAPSVSGKVTTLTAMITEWLAGGAQNYDTNETNANRNAALWDTGLLQPIPVDSVVPWQYARDTYTSTEALAGMTGADTRAAWEAASLDRQRAVLAALIDRIVIEPAERQGQRFDPDRLAVDWRA